MNIRVKITRDGSNRIVEMDLEEYLRGVVPSEMPSSWPAEALKAQAVAARTYAVDHISPEKDFDVDDTVRYQAYHENRTRETTDRAVAETAGQVLKYKDKLAQTVFSAANGGETVSAKQRWGNDIPYLPQKTDPFDALSGEKRNGHGVGMSQHGARQMALQGWDYREILLWYYPGCWIDGEVVTVQAVRVSTKADPLNIRGEASMDGYIIGRAKKGAVLLGRETKDGWRRVVGFDSTGAVTEGWASESYLEVME